VKTGNLWQQVRVGKILNNTKMKKLGKLNLMKEKMLSHEELVSFRGGLGIQGHAVGMAVELMVLFAGYLKVVHKHCNQILEVTGAAIVAVVPVVVANSTLR